jgi:hypothetical protein
MFLIFEATLEVYAVNAAVLSPLVYISLLLKRKMSEGR